MAIATSAVAILRRTSQVLSAITEAELELAVKILFRQVKRSVPVEALEMPLRFRSFQVDLRDGPLRLTRSKTNTSRRTRRGDLIIRIGYPGLAEEEQYLPPEDPDRLGIQAIQVSDRMIIIDKIIDKGSLNGTGSMRSIDYTGFSVTDGLQVLSFDVEWGETF